MAVTDKSHKKDWEKGSWILNVALMGPLKYDGIFVCVCEWSPASFNVSGQSCLKAHGANTGFTAVLQWALLWEHLSAADSKDTHWETSRQSSYNNHNNSTANVFLSNNGTVYR